MVAGTHGGRRLAAPAGRSTRPTSDRVREALFSALADVVPGATVLDGYAGSGALGIEALSRGAATAVLVEHDGRTAAVARRNLHDLDLHDRGVVVAQDMARWCRAPHPPGPFTLLLLDPPYAVALTEVFQRLADLRAAGAVAGGAAVVVERDRRDPGLDAEPPEFLLPGRRRVYGDTVLVSFLAAP